MRRYLLYVAHENQSKLARNHIDRLQGEKIKDASQGESYLLRNKALGQLELRVNILNNPDAIIPHLRQFPVDLLIYDERMGGIEATEVIHQLREDVETLTDLWGPDFHFPMGRIIAIVDDTEAASKKTFTLGRDHVRDIIVDPHSISKVLRWISTLLNEDLKQNQYKVGMAMSGGGLEGFLFQLGCIYALEQAFSERSIYDCEVYSGVSSGSIASSILACQVPIREVVSSFYGKSEVIPALRSLDLYDIAASDIAGRVLTQSVRWAGVDPMKWAQKIIRSIPTGFFKGQALENYVHEVISNLGGEDSFDNLGCEFFVGATNQDTFEHIVLGREPWTDVKISDAIRASCALPPFFTPKTIKDQNFIDGQITRTCNLELVVKRGCNLVFIIDPMKPYSTFEQGFVEQEGGIFTLIQTIKTLVHTRFRMALAHLTERYPDVDFIVIQPYEECAQQMSGSPMKLRFNPSLIELAYKGTLRRLRERHHIYSTKLAKFDFKLASQRLLLEIERKGLPF